MIIKLSESKKIKGGFTYYVITEEGGGSLKGLCIIRDMRRKVGLVMT